jgi:hypothetical protein
MQLRNMDKWCFERLVYTKYSRRQDNGYDKGAEVQDNGYLALSKSDPLPTDWAAYSALKEAPLSDYCHKDDGTFRWGDRDVSDHQFQQYPTMRRDFFPEYPHPLLDQAITKLESYRSQIAANVASGTTPEDKRLRDFTYAYPGIATMKTPTELGPA